MKQTILTFALICSLPVGCQQIQPPAVQTQQKTIIIERHVTPPPPPKGGIKIEINSGKPQCSPEHHCGGCDVCRRNGWSNGGVRIEIGPGPRAPSCTHDHHCGKCDVCKKNGWTVQIKIENPPQHQSLPPKGGNIKVPPIAVPPMKNPPPKDGNIKVPPKKDEIKKPSDRR